MPQVASIVAISTNRKEVLIATVSDNARKSQAFRRVTWPFGVEIEMKWTTTHRGPETEDGRWTWLSGRGTPAALISSIGLNKCGLCGKEATWDTQWPTAWKMTDHGCTGARRQVHSVNFNQGTTETKYTYEVTEVEDTPQPSGDYELEEVIQKVIQGVQQAMGPELIQEARKAILEAVDNRTKTLDNLVALLVKTELESRVPVERIVTIKHQGGKLDGLEVQLPSSAHYLTPLLLRYIAAKVNVFLVGPAGSGKTTAGSLVAKMLGLRFYPKAMSVSDDAWTLVGHKSPTTGEYVPGVAYEPFKDGGMLLLDEVDSADPSAMVTLNAMLANGIYMFPNGELIEQHPDFICIAAGNTYGRGATSQYAGRNPLDAATLDRFAFIEWGYDEAAEASWAGATPRVQQVLDLDGCTASPDEWLQVVQAVRAGVMQHGLHYVISPRASISGVRLLQQGVPVKHVADSVIWKGMPAQERARVLHTVAPRLTGLRQDIRTAIGG